MIDKVNRNGFRWEFRNCIVCGKKFVAKNYNSVRCFECQAIHKAQTEKERVQRVRAKKKIKPDKLHICEKIKSCEYGIRVGGIDICDYITIEKQKRPCPAGDCTVYKMKTAESEVENEHL